MFRAIFSVYYLILQCKLRLSNYAEKGFSYVLLTCITYQHGVTQQTARNLIMTSVVGNNNPSMTPTHHPVFGRGHKLSDSHLRNGSEFTTENNVLKGKVVCYDNDYTNYGEFVLRKLTNNPNLVGQIDTVTGEEWTYGKMRERSVRCALWMQSQGLHPRDVIALCSHNHLDHAMPCFAALYLGAIFNPWDVTMNADDLCHQMNITKPKMVFTSKGSAAVVAEAAEKAKHDLKIIVFGHVPGYLPFDSVISEPDIDDVEKFGCVSIESSSEIAAILLSSGTTGSPKGVALSHRALTMSSRPSAALREAGNVHLSFTAPHWVNAMKSMFIPLWLNIPALIVPLFEEHSACAFIEKYKGNWVFMTPYMINRLLKSDAVGKHDLSSLTEMCYSGAPLSIASYNALKELLPKVQIRSNYGMTECAGFVSVQSAKSKPGSCGEIMENAQVKVIDLDTGRTLGPNQKGELLLKSAAMMSFYWGNPQATAETIDEEGWVHSGDLGYYDENGEIFFIDRLKDIIRREDDEISPTEIESLILSMPGVKEVAVVGQPHLQDEDLLMAFVVKAKNSPDNTREVTETEIVDLVAAKLPDSRRLHAGVRFIDHLPKTPTDKIRRNELRDLARSMVTIQNDHI